MPPRDAASRAAFAQQMDELAPKLRYLARAAERLGYRGAEETFVEAAEQAEFAAELARGEIAGRYD